MPVSTDRTVGAPTCRRIAALLIASGAEVNEANLNAVWERMGRLKSNVRTAHDTTMVRIGQQQAARINAIVNALDFPVVPIAARLTMMPRTELGDIQNVPAGVVPVAAPILAPIPAPAVPPRPVVAPVAPANPTPIAAPLAPIAFPNPMTPAAPAPAGPERHRRTMAEVLAGVPARSTPAVFRNRGYVPNYPRTVAEVLLETQRFGGDTLRFLRAFKRTMPYRGTLDQRKALFAEMIGGLCHIYGVRPVALDMSGVTEVAPGDQVASGSSSYNGTTHTISLSGKLSVITALHEFAHARGANERQAVRWSLHLFRRIFPRLFAAAQQVGHCVISPASLTGSATNGSTRSPNAFTLDDVMRWSRGEYVPGLPNGAAAPAPVHVAAPIASRFRPAANRVSELAASLGITPERATQVLNILRSSGEAEVAAVESQQQ